VIVWRRGGLAQALEDRVEGHQAAHGLSEQDVDGLRAEFEGKYGKFFAAYSRWCRHRRFVRSEGGSKVLRYRVAFKPPNQFLEFNLAIHNPNPYRAPEDRQVSRSVPT